MKLKITKKDLVNLHYEKIGHGRAFRVLSESPNNVICKWKYAEDFCLFFKYNTEPEGTTVGLPLTMPELAELMNWTEEDKVFFLMSGEKIDVEII